MIQLSPGVSKSDRHGTKRKPKYRQREPKRKPQGAKREPKSDQNASKNQASEKVAKMSAKGGSNARSQGPFWEPFLIKNRKNGIQKGIQKSMPRKYGKIMKQHPK